MSKSRGNVVNPDEIVARYGADAFRLYEMFLGPLEQVKPWNTRGVEGTHRFLNRVWRLVAGSDADDGGNAPALAAVEPTREQQRALHQTIAKVTDDIEAMRFNTAISALMELTNAVYKWPQRAARRRRDVRAAARAARAASRRGALAAARAKRIAGVSRLARGGPRAAEGRRARDSRAGERQGARQDLRARRSAGKRSHRDRARPTRTSASISRARP